VLPADISRLCHHSISIIHDSLRLIIYNFSVIVTFPGAIIFFE